MNKKLKDKFNDKDEFMNENFPSIQFKRKRTKSNIKMIGKLLSLLIIAGLSGALFSSLVIESKYRDLVNELNDKLEKNKHKYNSNHINRKGKAVISNNK